MKSQSSIGHGSFLTTLREGMWVALGAAVFAWAANAISPRGLTLSRNYFPGAPAEPRTVAVHSQSNSNTPAGTNDIVAQAAAQVAARLAANGLKVASAQEAEQLFRDPKFAQGLFIFLDARDDALYQAGHVPGAYQFDHYHLPRFLPTVLPVCSVAEKVLVYCNGGDCEDSEFAAITLKDAGVPADKMVVFTGGFHLWETNALPVELGARNSGNLRKSQP